MFANEIGLISRKDIREFVARVVKAAPSYVFTDCPSSSSGKYHNSDELDGYGTVLHTKRVVKAAIALIKLHNCDAYGDHIIAACILHDLAKQGLMKGRHTVPNHAQVMAELLLDFLHFLPDRDFDIIRNCVFYHYGQWTIKWANKPLDKFTEPEFVCHMADYIASRKLF